MVFIEGSRASGRGRRNSAARSSAAAGGQDGETAADGILLNLQPNPSVEGDCVRMLLVLKKRNLFVLLSYYLQSHISNLSVTNRALIILMSLSGLSCWVVGVLPIR